MREEQKQNFEEQESTQTPPPIPDNWKEEYREHQSIYQGQPQHSEQYSYGADPNKGSAPKNYMTLNIIAVLLGIITICGNCCISLILAIIGIVFAAQVNSKFMVGNVQSAESSANVAKILGIISLVLSGLGILYMIYSIYTLLALGEWDLYMEEIRRAVEEAQGY